MIIKKEALDAVADQVSIVVKCLMAKANMYSHYGQILDQMTKVKYSTSTWNTHTLHPKSQNEATVDWIFLVDLLNFSFWSDATDATRVHTVTYKGQSYTGYWTLCACINRGSVFL